MDWGIYSTPCREGRGSYVHVVYQCKAKVLHTPPIFSDILYIYICIHLWYMLVRLRVCVCVVPQASPPC